MSQGTKQPDDVNYGGDYSYAIKSALFGVAVGDALGVPVKFKSREYLNMHPVTGMTGFGSHSQPPGTWSDDSSLTFCLAEALIRGYDLDAIGQNFVKWYSNAYWTAGGEIFDIGKGTDEAIVRLSGGTKPELSGDTSVSSNGNDSLMRILPLVFRLMPKPLTERFEITRQVSSVTNGHIRSIISCFYYLEFARQILEGREKYDIYRDIRKVVSGHLSALLIDPAEVLVFDRLLKYDIFRLNESEISTGSNVINTLEAAVWCLLTTESYSEAVLRAVNLGSDTDTTAAVTGGLAGLLYGFDGIPEEWIRQIRRKEDIEELAEKLAAGLNGN